MQEHKYAHTICIEILKFKWSKNGIKKYIWYFFFILCVYIIWYSFEQRTYIGSTSGSFNVSVYISEFASFFGDSRANQQCDSMIKGIFSKWIDTTALWLLTLIIFNYLIVVNIYLFIQPAFSFTILVL